MQAEAYELLEQELAQAGATAEDSAKKIILLRKMMRSALVTAYKGHPTGSWSFAAAGSHN
jgi:hypothetical protein